MTSAMTKSPCHNSGITGDGKCDVCMAEVKGGVPTVAPEPKVGNKDDAMGKTSGAATVPGAADTANTGAGDDTNKTE